MAEDMKMLIDCALPPGDPKHAQRVPLTAKEKKQRDKDAERAKTTVAPRTRSERDGRLAASDWTQVLDNPLSAEERLAWAEYRQQLRDMDMRGTPTFPEPPGG